MWPEFQRRDHAYHVLLLQRHLKYQYDQNLQNILQKQTAINIARSLTTKLIKKAIKNRVKHQKKVFNNISILHNGSAKCIQTIWKHYNHRQKKRKSAKIIGAWIVARFYKATLSLAFLTLTLHCRQQRIVDEKKFQKLLKYRQNLQHTIEIKACVFIQAWQRGNVGRGTFQKRIYLNKIQKIQKLFRKYNRIRKLHLLKRWNSAIVLQSWMRGIRDRSAASFLRLVRLSSLINQAIELSSLIDQTVLNNLHMNGKSKGMKNHHFYQNSAGIGTAATTDHTKTKNTKNNTKTNSHFEDYRNVSFLHCGNHQKRSVLTCKASPVELWVLRRRCGLKLQRWGRKIAVVKSILLLKERKRISIQKIERCWLKWMVQKTMYVVQIQCFGRCFLAKRRVDERRRKRIEMLDVMGDVEEYVVMRRLGD